MTFASLAAGFGQGLWKTKTRRRGVTDGGVGDPRRTLPNTPERTLMSKRSRKRRSRKTSSANHGRRPNA